MRNVQVAFDVKDEGAVAPVGYQEIGCHPIFDIKLTTLTRKVRFVAGGHTMDTPAAMTYASVVSRESVRIALLLAWCRIQIRILNVSGQYIEVV